jgi:hypothetical protein
MTFSDTSTNVSSEESHNMSQYLMVYVRNKPVARASTGLITFGRGPAARVAVVSVSELSPYPGRVAIEQLAPVDACVMGVCLQLTAYAAWWSCMQSVAIRREL